MIDRQSIGVYFINYFFNMLISLGFNGWKRGSKCLKIIPPMMVILYILNDKAPVWKIFFIKIKSTLFLVDFGWDQSLVLLQTEVNYYSVLNVLDSLFSSVDFQTNVKIQVTRIYPIHDKNFSAFKTYFLSVNQQDINYNKVSVQF